MRLLDDATPGLSTAVTRWTNELRLPIDFELVAGWVSSEELSLGMRVEALRLLDARDAGSLAGALDASLRSPETKLRLASMKILSKRDWMRAWSEIEVRWPAAAIMERQMMLEIMGNTSSTVVSPPTPSFRVFV